MFDCVLAWLCMRFMLYKEDFDLDSSKFRPPATACVCVSHPKGSQRREMETENECGTQTIDVIHVRVCHTHVDFGLLSCCLFPFSEIFS